MSDIKILITNDDGIASPGLKAAVAAVMKIGEVTVVAPSRQQTGAGRGLTGDKEAKLVPVDYQVNGMSIAAYHCDCSPALIVRHGLRTLFQPGYPDLLISGINYGENLGASITCSGTVGAALEAASYGVPSIAVSKQTEVESHHKYTEQDWSATAYFLHHFSNILIKNKADSDVDVLKIDVPFEATSNTAWKMTKLARSGYYTKEIEDPGPETRLNEGRTVIKFNEKTLDPDTDIHAFAVQKVVSVTPLSIDLTSRVCLSGLEDSFKGQ